MDHLQWMGAVRMRVQHTGILLYIFFFLLCCYNEYIEEYYEIWWRNEKMKEGEGGEQCAGSLKTRGMHLRVK